MSGLAESAAQRRIEQQLAGARVVTHKPTRVRYLVALEVAGTVELIPISGQSKYFKAADLNNGDVWE